MNHHTDTTEGPIPHLRLTCEAGTFAAPVKLATERRGNGPGIAYARRNDGHSHPVPLVREGRYVYALPGGGEVLA